MQNYLKIHRYCIVIEALSVSTINSLINLKINSLVLKVVENMFKGKSKVD